VKGLSNTFETEGIRRVARPFAPIRRRKTVNTSYIHDGVRKRCVALGGVVALKKAEKKKSGTLPRKPCPAAHARSPMDSNRGAVCCDEQPSQPMKAPSRSFASALGNKWAKKRRNHANAETPPGIQPAVLTIKQACLVTKKKIVVNPSRKRARQRPNVGGKERTWSAPSVLLRLLPGRCTRRALCHASAAKHRESINRSLKRMSR